MRRGRAVQLGLPSPDGALLRLHASELDDERLWEVMSAMGLHEKVGMVLSLFQFHCVLFACTPCSGVIHSTHLMLATHGLRVCCDSMQNVLLGAWPL